MNTHGVRSRPKTIHLEIALNATTIQNFTSFSSYVFKTSVAREKFVRHATMTKF